jgi:hypothetical protein
MLSILGTTHLHLAITLTCWQSIWKQEKELGSHRCCYYNHVSDLGAKHFSC